MNSYADAVRVGVAGATGYAGTELVRLLARHPRVRLAAAMSRVGAEPRRLPALARVWDEPIGALDVDALADRCDAVFLALPDQASASVAPALVARGRRVFDLSGAFRLRDAALRRQWYPHSPANGVSPVYGLTERYRGDLGASTLVACAGCYPTAAILALQPLVSAGLLAEPIVIDAKSGVSGAGKTPTERTHFSECHGNLSAYGVFAHRHAAEIEQEVGIPVTFVPHLLPIDRGILETIYAPLTPSADADAVAAGVRGRLRGGAVRPAHHARSAGDQACGAHELLRHRLARASHATPDRHRRVRRQPRQGSGGPGGAELQRGVRLRRDPGAAGGL